jgi:autotransporter translocation and assembly factor TamB
MKKTKSRLRRVLLILAGLFLLILVGSLVWLRSSAGERFVFGIIEKALADQGLSIAAARFEGPLPLTVRAQNITLADPQGQFLTARSLAAKVKLAALFRATIQAELRLSGVELLRRPVLPPTAPKESSSSSLPVALDIDLELTDSRLSELAINPDNPDLFALVNLKGQVFFDSGQLTFQVDGSLLDEVGRGLTIQTALGRSGDPANDLDSSAPENLDLRLTILDQGGRLTGPRPDLPQLLKMTIQGQGPLTDWSGQVELTAQNGEINPELNASLAETLAQATIKFQGRTGQLLVDVAQDPHFAVAIDLKTLAKIIPPASRPALPNLPELDPNAPLTLSAQITAEPQQYQGRLAWTSPLGDGISQDFRLTRSLEGWSTRLPLALTLGPLWELPPTPIKIDLIANLAGEWLEISSLNLTGEGLKGDIAGKMSPHGEKVNATIELAEVNVLYPLLRKLTLLDQWPGAIKVHLQGERAPNNQMTAVGELELGDVGALWPPSQGLINASYQLRGDPNDLKFELNLASPKLDNPAGPFMDLNLFVSGHYENKPDLVKAQGLIRAAAQNLKTPLDLTARLDYSQEGEILSASIADFHLIAPGLKAQSQQLSLNLKPQRGAPELAGSLSAQVLDWPLIGQLVGQNLSGAPASLAIQIKHDAEPTAEVELNLPDLKVGDILALKGVNLKLTSLVADDAQLRLDLTQGPGQIGPIPLKAGQIHLTGAGKWSQGLAGDLKARLTGATGDLLNLEANYDLTEKKALIKRLFLAPPQLKGSVSLTKELRLDLANGVKLENLVASLSQGGLIQLSGQVGGTAPLKAQLKAQSLPINFLDPKIVDLPAGKVDLNVDYQQGVGGSYDLRTTLTDPTILSLNSKGTLKANALQGQALVSWPRAAWPIKINFQLPTRPAGQLVELAPNGPIAVEADWRGPAGQLWSLTGLEDMALKGEVDFKIRARGPLSKPKTELTLYLAQGAFQDPTSGLTLKGLALSGHMDEHGEIKLLAEAKDNGSGRLALEGTVNPLASPPSVKARAQLDHLSPLHRDDVEMTISALATLEGPFNALKLMARVLVEKAEISLAQGFGGPPIKTLDFGQQALGASSPLDLDLTIEMPNQFYIRGRGLDSEWQGNLKLVGSASKPTISGYIKPVRGYLELLSKQFTIAKGEIHFFESQTLNPALNLELTRQASDIMAVLRLSGYKDSPRINLESQPPRPADEILAQILFGKNTSQLSRVETLQLANSLKSLTGLGPKMDLFTPINAVRDTLGLSVLRLGETSTSPGNRILKSNSFRDNLNLDKDDEPAESSSATIEAGKYLTDRVYVGLEQNLAQNSTGVRIEVELTPNLSLESKTTTQSNRVGVGWKKDY